ncbi:MAG: hypothetical protein GY714_17155 [Desulfobacterales bacterium]|nr:hypothetical protein [Desulfobacterales bacterium]MCP4159167.1 hypothetical protein [Deltaproteobacteria bacterium]
MVFITSMLTLGFGYYWGSAGVGFAFFVALMMEVVNLFWMTNYAKKAEKAVKMKYDKIIDGYRTKIKHSDIREQNTNQAIEKKKSTIRDYKLQIAIVEKRADKFKEELDQQKKLNSELEKMMSQKSFM